MKALSYTLLLAPLLFLILAWQHTPLPDIDHAIVWRSLDAQTLAQGKAHYESLCSQCHGMDGTASLPSARSFNTDRLKFGNDPYSLWQTLTFGRGMMGAQTWLTPEERYYTIQYIREVLIKPDNPSQYFEVTDTYLESLPRAREGTQQSILAAAAEGLQEAGQAWAQTHPGDYGPVLYGQLQDKSSAAFTVYLGEDVYLSYNLLRMNQVAAWRGQLDLSETKFLKYRGEGKPVMDGKPLAGLDVWQWAYRGSYETLVASTSVRTPLPEDWMRFNGHYQHGDQVLLSYTILGRDVVEHPQVHRLGKQVVLSHTLQIAPGKTGRKLFVGQQQGTGGIFVMDNLGAPDPPRVAFASDHLALSRRQNRAIAAAVIGQTEGMRWEFDAHHRLVLHIPPDPQSRTVQVFRYSAPPHSMSQFTDWVRQQPAPDALTPLLQGGPRRWNETISTTGTPDTVRPHYDPIYYKEPDHNTPDKLVDLPEDYPYTVDEIMLPFANPWNAWMRPTALDFFADGRLVLATYPGDVWVVDGLDDFLDQVRWQRIATGLYEPMGVRVVNHQIYVTARDRIVRLHDLNGDGETDFYESFYADQDVSDFFHAFAFGLQTDAEGNFYYVKSGQYTNNALPGNVVKVSPDGSRSEVAGTGFRTPNGMTVSPEGNVFVSDNQGSWMPANKINHVRPDGFYGYVQNLRSDHWSPDGTSLSREALRDSVPPPATFDEPMLWIPQEFDNSPGGGTWSAPDWGPLGNRFIHTSFGKGWVYHVMPQEVNGGMQGALVALPFQFESGLQRARVNPADGQVYVVGLTGWDDGFATRYGSLNRIRYRSSTGPLLLDARVEASGIALTFNEPLDPDLARDKGRYEVLQWNYKWLPRYGSEDWSVARPGEKGRDEVAIKSIRHSADGKTVLVEIEDLQPVDQMRLRFDLKTAQGRNLKDSVYLTIHHIPVP